MCAPLPTAILPQANDNYRPNPGLPGIEGAEGTSNGTGTGSTSVIRFRDGSRYEFTVFGRGNQVLTAQIDPWGNRLTVQRNSGTIGAVGIAQSVTDSAGRVTRIEYNGALISRLTDTSGRTLNFSYDSQSRLTQVSDPLGNLTQYAWDSNNRITQKTDAL
ncbi:MAG: RHS repeat protein, partial [Sulfuricella sp.]|nr:RHS repeat protein [Sulfuricella sp.]